MPQTFQRELDIGHPQRRIHYSGIQPDGVVFIWAAHCAEAAHVSGVQLFRLPGQQSFFNLFGKTVRIRRCAKCFFGQNRGRLMMSVPVAISSRETRHQHIRAKGADDAHHIG